MNYIVFKMMTNRQNNI